MFILLAHNVTGTKKDGTSDYVIQARINDNVIAEFPVAGHVRKDRAAELLRKIADTWDAMEASQTATVNKCAAPQSQS